MKHLMLFICLLVVAGGSLSAQVPADNSSVDRKPLPGSDPAGIAMPRLPGAPGFFDASTVYLTNRPSAISFDPGITGSMQGNPYSGTNAGNPWEPVGPFGGDVTDLTADPLHPLHLFAAAGAPFISTNGGESWEIIESLNTLASGDINGIRATGNGTLFATSYYQYGKIFRSTDSGNQWEIRTIPVSSGGICLAADPSDPLTIYAGLQSNLSSAINKVIVRSGDGGTTWNWFDLTAALPVGYAVVSICVDPEDSQTIFAIGNSGLSDALVAASFDGGATWENRTGNLPFGVPYNDVEIAGGKVYVAGGQLFGSQNMGIYESADNGLTWNSLSASFPNQVANDILADPLMPDHLFVATEGDGIYFSPDAGATWNFTSTGAGSDGAARALVLQPGSSQILYAGFLSLAICKSYDGGTSWEYANNGISSLMVTDVEIDPQDPQRVIIGFEAENSGGCYLSSDGAQNWSLAQGLPGTRFSQVTVGADGTLWAWSNGPTTVAPEGLYKSTDQGVTWSNTGPDIGSLFETQIFALAASESDPGLLFIGGNNFGVNGWASVIYRTGNGGQTWINTYIGPEENGYSIRYLWIDPSGNDEVIYAAYKSEIGGGILKSINGGFSWEETGTSIPIPYKWAGAVVTAASDPDSLFAGIGGYGNPGTVCLSGSGGTTWSTTSLSMGTYSRVNDLVIAPANPRVIYLASSLQGVWLTTDGAITWSAANEGMPAAGITGFSRPWLSEGDYWMYASTSTNSAFLTRIYDPVTGWESRKPEPAITVWPVPSRGTVTIDWSDEPGKVNRIDQYTASGECVGSFSVSLSGTDTRLEINGLEPGIWLFRVVSDRQIQTVRVVVLQE